LAKALLFELGCVQLIANVSHDPANIHWMVVFVSVTGNELRNFNTLVLKSLFQTSVTERRNFPSAPISQLNICGGGALFEGAGYAIAKQVVVGVFYRNQPASLVRQAIGSLGLVIDPYLPPPWRILTAQDC